MSEQIALSRLGEHDIQQLALLYLQKCDISVSSPEAFLDKYDEAYYKIRNHYQTTRANPSAKIGFPDLH